MCPLWITPCLGRSQRGWLGWLDGWIFFAATKLPWRTVTSQNTGNVTPHVLTLLAVCACTFSSTRHPWPHRSHLSTLCSSREGQSKNQNVFKWQWWSRPISVIHQWWLILIILFATEYFLHLHDLWKVASANFGPCTHKNFHSHVRPPRLTCRS